MTLDNSLARKIGVTRFAQGPFGRIGLVAGFLCFIFVALYPFDWDPPVKVKNGACFLTNGNLMISTDGVLQELTPPLWIDDAKESGMMTVELRVRPQNLIQEGPARIFAFTQDHYNGNLLVGQIGDALKIEIYNLDHLETKSLENLIPQVFEADTWRDIAVHFEPERYRILVDGVPVLEEVFPGKNILKKWDRSNTIALGNEHTGRRPWLGEIAVAKIHVGDQTYDLLRSTDMDLPEWYWSARFAPQLRSITRLTYLPELGIDYVLNYLCFLPIGFLLACRTRSRRPVLRAIGWCGLVSLLVEIAQIFFAQCYPSFFDLSLNTLGGSAGAVVAMLFCRPSWNSRVKQIEY